MRIFIDKEFYSLALSNFILSLRNFSLQNLFPFLTYLIDFSFFWLFLIISTSNSVKATTYVVYEENGDAEN